LKAGGVSQIYRVRGATVKKLYTRILTQSHEATERYFMGSQSLREVCGVENPQRIDQRPSTGVFGDAMLLSDIE